MTVDQTVSIFLIMTALGLFVWGRLRYDIVALMTLMLGVIFGVVPDNKAFYGFGHPAVITVMSVLIISKALDNSGIVAALSRAITPGNKYATVQIFTMTFVVGALSGFMNNVGALALMLPVAMQQAVMTQRSPSFLMMPLAFGSLLGGLSTLIGTPPNIIISSFRAETMGAPFQMFDFLPVGGGVALAGIFFISLIGWRFLPQRKDPKDASTNLFELKGYITEVVITPESDLIGMLVRDLEDKTAQEVTVVSLLRKERKILAPSGFVPLQEGDILLLEGDPSALTSLVDAGDIEIGSEETVFDQDAMRGEDVEVIEAVIPPDSRMDGATARSLRLRSRFGINLLAVAQQGRTIMERLGRLRFAAGDVLLLQGDPQSLRDAIAVLGLLPLATRDLNLDRRRTIIPLLTFAGAIAIAVAGYLPIQICFVIVVLLMVVGGYLSIRDIYESIDWMVVILLGALIPVGQALHDTGATQEIARGILSYTDVLTPVMMLAVIMVATMMLSDVVNNAVTAVVMAPIGVSLATQLGVNPDSFLMAIAIGASCSFLTPIGHQSNTLVMGPGGYKFTDYWRLGLPLEIVIIAVSVPLITIFWPL